jgi:hypothetical protein
MHIRLGPGDVWDEREDDLEIFGIGSDGDSDDEQQHRRQTNAGARGVSGEDTRPKIIVSEPPSA